MAERLSFIPSIHAEALDDDAVLFTEHGHVTLPGRVYACLVPLLDGRHTEDQIVDLLAGEVFVAELYYALGQLKSRGYIATATDTVPRDRAAFWSTLGRDPVTAEHGLSTARVRIAQFGAAPVAPLEEQLAAAGIALSADPDLVVAVTESYLDPDLAAFNAEMLAAGRSWLLLKPDGVIPWIGPLFRPGGPCWECLAQRLRTNRLSETVLRQRHGDGAPPIIFAAAFTPARQAALNLAMVEVAKHLTGTASSLADTLLTLDLASLTTERHTVVRRPQCPRCGNPTARAERTPLVLESQPKQFTVDGGHRAAPPERFLERYGHHVSALTGAVPYLIRVPLDQSGVLHVYASGQNLAMQAHGAVSARAGLRTNCSGKGLSDAQARASAIAEALERHAGVFQGDEPRYTASYQALGDAAIHPAACMLYSDAQYRDRDRWNRQGSPFQHVPVPFDAAAEVEWTPVWSVTKARLRYLPTAYCYFDYPAPTEPFCLANSNGNAAGNTREEAILQGFLELAERDAVAIWWYNRIRRPAVDLDSFASSRINELRRAYTTLGREVWALDLTNDLDIPTFVALSRRIDGGPEEISFGFGAHFDAEVAVTRALTEMNQFLVWQIPRDGRPAPGMAEPDIRRWMETATLTNQPHLVANDDPPHRAADLVRPQHADLRDDVLRCKAIVEQLGLELLVLDQTRPDTGLPVVKVIVPGLRHFWARFAPGRLYDVPVRLGWLPQPLTEPELNPIPLFF